MRGALALAFALVAALGVAVLGGCSNDVINGAECAPGDNAEDKSDECPFGPPGGPRISETQCTTDQIDPTSAACKGVSWSTTYAALAAVTPAGNCGAMGCHGGLPGAAGLHLDPPSSKGAAGNAYLTLKEYNGGLKSAYINVDPTTGSAANSWIVCNLAGTDGGGTPMPQGYLVSSAIQAEVKTWVSCGAPAN